MLQLRDVTVLRDDRALFQPISVTIEAGSVMTCMGASGLGKTTLLSALVSSTPGLILSGEVLLDNERRPQTAPLLGVTQTVFQDPVLFPHLSVGANVALSIARHGQTEQRQRVRVLLDALGLGGLAEADPMTLSRGQRMRVSVARALFARPRILLLDEPIRALDADTREDVKAVVFQAVAEYSMMALLVTHQDDDRPETGALVCLTPFSSNA